MNLTKRQRRALSELFNLLRSPLKSLPTILALVIRMLPVFFEKTAVSHVGVIECGMLKPNMEFTGELRAEPDIALLPNGKEIVLCSGVSDAATLKSADSFGSSPHITMLANGNLLCAYCPPCGGVRMRLSTDAGKTWSQEKLIDAVAGKEVTRITSVQQPDGSVITVYNHRFATEKPTRLKYTHWSLTNSKALSA